MLTTLFCISIVRRLYHAIRELARNRLQDGTGRKPHYRYRHNAYLQISRRLIFAVFADLFQTAKIKLHETFIPYLVCFPDHECLVLSMRMWLPYRYTLLLDAYYILGACFLPGTWHHLIEYTLAVRNRVKTMGSRTPSTLDGHPEL